MDTNETMSRSVRAFAVQVGEGLELTTPIGGSVTIKADTGQTNGSLTVMDVLVPPDEGPGLHTHVREDEVWYVVEGDFRFKAGDSMFQASTGGMVFGPRGLPHAFQNIGTGFGRLLVITTPSGLERIFEQSADLPHPVPPAAFAAICDANWVELAGPPLALSDPL